MIERQGRRVPSRSGAEVPLSRRRNSLGKLGAVITLTATVALGCSSSTDAAPASAGTGGATDSGAGGASDGGGSGSGGKAQTGRPLSLTSGVFSDGALIPAEYRCQAPSPDLAWTGGPGAASYAFVLQDVTPGISKGFFHWVIYDIPGAFTSLPKSVPVGYAPATPEGAHQSPIWNGTVGFNGPCGGNNTYELTLHALDIATLPDATPTSTSAQILAALQLHDLEKVTMTLLSKP